jgi:hypothetical protein
MHEDLAMHASLKLSGTVEALAGRSPGLCLAREVAFMCHACCMSVHMHDGSGVSWAAPLGLARCN